MSDPNDEIARRLREQRAHIEAVETLLRETNTKNVELRAQVIAVSEAAQLRLGQLMQLIDTLHQRIESMVKEWEAQVISKFPASDLEKETLLKVIEPFRLSRLDEASEGDARSS